MIEYIKKKFVENPDKIVEFLEMYDYCHFSIGSKYITFGRDEISSPKSIVIRLEDNDACLIKDYARNLCYDIINFVIKCRNEDFRDVVQNAKAVLNIEDGFFEPQAKSAFGGFYNKIKAHTVPKIKTYPIEVLNKYDKAGNVRFLRDGISLDVQHEFNIGYDKENQAITIPIWNELGELIGVKARRNVDVQDGEQKYFYLMPCQMSSTLYGYWQNYSHLQDGIVWVFESEKSVLQTTAFGMHNAVAIGSSSISKRQAQLILSCNPRKIILAHDKSLGVDIIDRNAATLKVYGRMKNFETYYLDMENDDSIPDKSSPSDLGKEKFIEIGRQHLKKI